MASKGGKGSPAKIPKKTKREPEPDDNDDDNFLEDLVMTTETDKGTAELFNTRTGWIRDQGHGQENETGQKTRENCSCDRETRRRRDKRNGTRKARTGGQ